MYLMEERERGRKIRKYVPIKRDFIQIILHSTKFAYLFFCLSHRLFPPTFEALDFPEYPVPAAAATTRGEPLVSEVGSYGDSGGRRTRKCGDRAAGGGSHRQGSSRMRYLKKKKNEDGSYCDMKNSLAP